MKLLPRLRRPGRVVFAACVLLGGLVGAASAQPQGPPLVPRQVQAGLGLVPGVGLQGGYVGQRSIYTLEGMFYSYASPSFAQGEWEIQTSLGMGASFRPLGLIQTIGNTGFRPYTIDLGARLGPGLNFLFGREETPAEENQRFTLTVDLFVRVTTDAFTDRTLFVELGTHRAFLRAGFWLPL